jgi:hypothetical protein
MEWVGIALLVVLVPMLILCLSNRWLGAWACHVFSWHLAPKEQGFDGCSFTGTCPRCNKAVLQDSQGNWF